MALLPNFCTSCVYGKTMDVLSFQFSSRDWSDFLDEFSYFPLGYDFHVQHIFSAAGGDSALRNWSWVTQHNDVIWPTIVLVVGLRTGRSACPARPCRCSFRTSREPSTLPARAVAGFRTPRPSRRDASTAASRSAKNAWCKHIFKVFYVFHVF